MGIFKYNPAKWLLIEMEYFKTVYRNFNVIVLYAKAGTMGKFYLVVTTQTLMNTRRILLYKQRSWRPKNPLY